MHAPRPSYTHSRRACARTYACTRKHNTRKLKRNHAHTRTCTQAQKHAQHTHTSALWYLCKEHLASDIIDTTADDVTRAKGGAILLVRAVAVAIAIIACLSAGKEERNVSFILNVRAGVLVVCLHVLVCACVCLYVLVCACMCLYVLVCACMCLYVLVCACMC